jgi:sugar (pentulose or hexulose) kinase
MFLGLTAGHGRGQMVRAVMEGVGLACYDAFSVLVELGGRPDRIIMAAGGARSQLWRQILADIFDLPVQPLLINEQSAVGACLLAGAGISAFDPLEAAQSWAVYGPVVEPQPDHTARYHQLLAIYRNAYHKHIDDFQKLSELE